MKLDLTLPKKEKKDKKKETNTYTHANTHTHRHPKPERACTDDIRVNVSIVEENREEGKRVEFFGAVRGTVTYR